MKTHLQIRVADEDFQDIKTLAGLEDTSMSAMLTSAIDHVADHPDVLTRIILQLLEESRSQHEAKTHEPA